MANLLQKRDGCSTSHPTPLAFKDKQKQGQREVFTHFVSLPLALYPELKKNLEAFQNSVLGNNHKNPLKFQATLAEMGIESSIFVSPKSLHLTVVMLKLENSESVVKAQNLLKSISSNVRQALKNRPVFIRLRGLDCMNGSLDKTRVLYVPVEEVGHEGRLLNACHVIIDAFEKAGFAGKDTKSRLKLHATVMNASYRKDKSKKMDTFDAREIHKEFGNKDWGTYLITEAHISQRYKYDSNGYFHCCASLSFPPTPAFIERAYGVTNIRSHIPITLDLSEKHNYGAWRQLFLRHCESFGFHGHLDGSLVSNGDGDVSWKKRDETVKLWLYTTLSPSLSRVVFHTQSTSREIWLRIENQFRSNLNVAAPEYQNRGNSFPWRPQYQPWRSPYLPRPEQYQQWQQWTDPMWQPEQYQQWSYPQQQPYLSSGVVWNGPPLSNSYNNWQNPGFGNMYGPPSPDLQAFSAMNLQEPMGAPQSYNMDMGATTPHPWAHNASPEASTSRSTPQALKENQIQIVQGQSEPFTHFVSIPLVIYPELRDNLVAFKKSILDKNPTILAERRIDDSLFASPNTFHLTVVMLKLGSKGSLVKAQNILKDISPKVSLALKKRPVFITLKGLDCMNGSLEKTRTRFLYAPVEEVGNEGRLLKACHVIIDAFDSAKLAGKDPKSDFKLHATVMNTTYRKYKSKEMDTFDAEEIHKEFGSKDWGTYLIKEAHISQRKPYNPNVYFLCCGSLSFPEN